MFENIKKWFTKEKRTLTIETGLSNGLVLSPTLSGINVNPEKPLTQSGFYSAVRHISESIGSLPIRILQKQTDGGFLVKENHPLHDLIAHTPNSYQTSVIFREFLVTQLLLWGHCYAKIEFRGDGRAIALHPLMSQFIETKWDVTNKQLQYLVTASPWTEGEELEAYEVISVPLLSLDGLIGVNPVQYSRESMALSIALEKWGAAFMGQGCRPSGFLKTMGQLSDKARQNLQQSWKRDYQGHERTGSVPVLEDGLEWQPANSTADENQFNDTRLFQISEQARWAKIPLAKLDPSRATWNNLETYNKNYVSETLAPIIMKLEQEFNKKLLLPSEKGKYKFDFDVSGLLRGDSRTRFANYESALRAGWMTKNEVRLMEFLPPKEGNDELPTAPQLPPQQGDNNPPNQGEDNQDPDQEIENPDTDKEAE